MNMFEILLIAIIVLACAMYRKLAEIAKLLRQSGEPQSQTSLVENTAQMNEHLRQIREYLYAISERMSANDFVQKRSDAQWDTMMDELRRMVDTAGENSQKNS